MKAVVITAGGLHLGYVGGYGSDWFATPHLDELAARAAVFDQHYSDQPDVQAARLAWLSGAYHFPTAGGGTKDVAAADLTSLFRQHKITLAFVGGPGASTSSDFGSDWDIVERRSRERGARSIDETHKLAAKTVRRLARKDRWLLWIDLPMLTPPWDVRPELLEFYFSSERDQEEEEDEAESVGERLDPLLEPALDTMDTGDESTIVRLQQTYAALVRQCDEGIGGILDLLSEARLGDESMVLFTADRGLPLGEHGVVGEVRPWLHEELIHLPLIVRLPADAQASVRSSALTQPVDLLPTLADAFGVAIPPVHGRSLMPLIREEVQEVRGYACAGLRRGSAAEWALRTPEWAFLLPIEQEENGKRVPQLYLKPDDRWEVNNVIQHHHELVEELEKVLRAFVEATDQGGPLEPPPLPDVDEIRKLQPAAEEPRSE
jgi:arylsulfatase A-like enzyme